jgi:hypothetical protein
MPLDEQLISHSNSQKNEADNSGSDSSAVRSASLREAMRGNESNGSLESQGDIRVDRMTALRQGGEEGLKDKAVAEILSPAKQGTSSLLKAAWENLVDSFGLTLIWIDIHIFLSQVLGKDLFCSLGEEWFPKGTPRNIEGAKKSVGMTEGMGVACLNIGCLIIVLSALSLVAMIVSGVTNPLKAISAIFGSLWCAVIGGCKK